MQIRSITMDAVSLATAQAIQKNGAPIQLESNLFGPSCRVTISQEGRNLSRQQVGQDAESVKAVREQLRQLDKAEREKEAEEEYREGLDNAEKTARALSDPDEDDELKAAIKAVLRENYEHRIGGALTDKDLEELEDDYKWYCQQMKEGYQVSIVNISDGIIGDRKMIRCSSLKDGYDKWLERSEKAETQKNGQDIPGLKERKDKVIEGKIERYKADLMKKYMTPSLLERYSEKELCERIERYCERAREKMYAYFHPTDDFGFTDEELAELNEKLSANQVPLSEQEKAVEEFAKRRTPADHANVTRIEPGDFTTLPAMPENESQQ